MEGSGYRRSQVVIRAGSCEPTSCLRAPAGLPAPKAKEAAVVERAVIDVEGLEALHQQQRLSGSSADSEDAEEHEQVAVAHGDVAEAEAEVVSVSSDSSERARVAQRVR